MRAVQSRGPAKTSAAPLNKSKSGSAIGTVSGWFAALRGKALSFTRGLLS
ncbi:MAG: hypothetical protein NTV88_01610 [Candidatus Micrarchaeota archaeon]|nr:hypothetical protein [Candidatus Micrarchaeota archaeon]